MSKVYEVLTTLKTQLEADDFVNTVSQGSIDDIDNIKQTMFPLSHIMINQATIEGSVWRYSITIFCMDIVDKSPISTTDEFVGNDNEMDVLNTQLAVFNRVHEVLVRGANAGTFQMDGNPTCEPFTERFENYLAGWACTFYLLIPNDMSKC